MIRSHSCAASLVFVWIALSGCQSIPTRPLGLDNSLNSLQMRELSPEPVLEFARRLAQSRSGQNVPFDPADGLSLQEAEAIALWYNTDVRISRLEVDRAAALANVAGRWDDPGLDLSGGRKREEIDAPDSGSDAQNQEPAGIERSWIGSASLSITIPISGRVAADRKARSAEHHEAMCAATEEEWRTLRALREAWLTWSACVERVNLLETQLSLVSQFSGVAQSLASAGELDPGSARMFSIEHAHLTALHQSAVLRSAGLRGPIFRLMGLHPEAPVELVPALQGQQDDKLDALDATALALRHPEVSRLAAAYATREARLRIELRKQYPDLTISPTYSDEGGESSITLGLGLLPIPVWNANRPGIAEALAQRDIARARAEGMLLEVVARIDSTRNRAAAAKVLREGLAAHAAREADLQMSEAQALLQAGEADLGMVFQSLMQAYAIKEELLETSLEELTAQGELDLLASFDAFALPGEESAL